MLLQKKVCTSVWFAINSKYVSSSKKCMMLDILKMRSFIGILLKLEFLSADLLT